MKLARNLSFFIVAAALVAGCNGRRGGGGNPDSGMHGDGSMGDGSMPPGDGGGVDFGLHDGALPDFGPLPDLGLHDGGGGFCGDFSVGPGEQCDSGGVDSSTCDSDCTFAMCGDFHVNVAAGEECDSGPSGSATCSTSCTSIAAAFCGDGVVNGTEQCDDGGTFSGDGCSASCTIESGWTCSGSPSVCSMMTTGSTVNIFVGPNSISGSLSTTDPTWTRPNTGCTTGSTSVHYKTYTLHNTGVTTLTLTITATWPSGGDGFLAAYSSPFSPSSGTTGCLAANDDYTGVATSQLTGVTLPSGGNIVLVVTEYSSGTVAGLGAYSISIDAA